MSTAIDDLTGDERSVLIKLIARAALNEAIAALNKDERPARLDHVAGRDVHEGNAREHDAQLTTVTT